MDPLKVNQYFESTKDFQLAVSAIVDQKAYFGEMVEMLEKEFQIDPIRLLEKNNVELVWSKVEKITQSYGEWGFESCFTTDEGSKRITVRYRTDRKEWYFDGFNQKGGQGEMYMRFTEERQEELKVLCILLTSIGIGNRIPNDSPADKQRFKTMIKSINHDIIKNFDPDITGE